MSKVLLTEFGRANAQMATALEAAGHTVSTAEFAFSAPVADDHAYHRALDLVGRLYEADAWLVVASSQCIDGLANLIGESRLRIALNQAEGLGAKFAAASSIAADCLRGFGVSEVVLPTLESSTPGLLHRLEIDAGPLAVVPRSGADFALSQGLLTLGWQVVDTAVYEIASVENSPEVVPAIIAGEFDLVVLSSPAAARGFAEHVHHLPQTTAVLVTDATTEHAATAHGLLPISFSDVEMNVAVETCNLLDQVASSN